MRMMIFLLLFFSFSAIADMKIAAKIHVRLGFLYLAHGYKQQAQKEFSIALFDDPHHAASWYGMAYYFQKTGQENRAKKYYETALKIDPKSAAAQNNYGIYLCERHEYQRAIRYFLLAAHETNNLNSNNAYHNATLCRLDGHKYKR